MTRLTRSLEVHSEYIDSCFASYRDVSSIEAYFSSSDDDLDEWIRPFRLAFVKASIGKAKEAEQCLDEFVKGAGLEHLTREEIDGLFQVLRKAPIVAKAT
ncbi:MAG: hypothetical protein AB7W16_10565 [Candidatus Obscuribacterales bacterium]